MKGFAMAPIRIRTKVGQAEDGPAEVIGKWFVEVHVCDNTRPDLPLIGEPLGPFGPRDTEEQAKELSKDIARVAVEAIGGTHVLDMKTPTKGMQHLDEMFRRLQ